MPANKLRMFDYPKSVINDYFSILDSINQEHSVEEYENGYRDDFMRDVVAPIFGMVLLFPVYLAATALAFVVGLVVDACCALNNCLTHTNETEVKQEGPSVV